MLLYHLPATIQVRSRAPFVSDRVETVVKSKGKKREKNDVGEKKGRAFGSEPAHFPSGGLRSLIGLCQNI